MRIRFHEGKITETGSMTKKELLDLGFRDTGIEYNGRRIYANGDWRIAFDSINHFFTKYMTEI